MTLIFPLFATLFGLIIGSFLNVVIHRGPALWNLTDVDSPRGNLAFPRSHCPACEAPIRIAHLVPIVGYLVLRGRCASCNAKISLRYPIIEILGAAAALIAITLFGATPTALCAAIFLWFLIALAAIDLDTGYLPDALTLPLLLIGLAVSFAGLFAPWPDAVFGALAGYAAFRLVGAIFHAVRGIEGLGQGDAKLLAAIGAWLGWQALAPVVFIAAMLGLIGALALKLANNEITPSTPIAFGPALAGAAAIVLVMAAAFPNTAIIGATLPIFP